ncbi:MAG TPA: hypothetical protein VGJ68_21735 [Bradyrhizobium sp.]|jgi:hypothetical protein
MTVQKHKLIISEGFELSSTGANFIVRYAPPITLTIGSGSRAVHAVRLVKSVLKRLPGCVVQIANNAFTAHISDITKSEILDAIERANQRLDEFSEEKLTAKTVEKILNVTTLERRRWTKDGRLPHSGTAFFQAGRTQVQVATYSRETVLFFASRPDLIRTWREADKREPAQRK